MIRHCSECNWCTPIDTAHGNTVYICADEDGGAFLQETGLLGFCGKEEKDDDES